MRVYAGPVSSGVEMKTSFSLWNCELAFTGSRELARVNLLGCLACLLRNLLGIYGRARRIRRSKQKTAQPPTASECHDAREDERLNQGDVHVFDMYGQ